MSVDDIVQQIDQTDGFPELPSQAKDIGKAFSNGCMR